MAGKQVAGIVEPIFGKGLNTILASPLNHKFDVFPAERQAAIAKIMDAFDRHFAKATSAMTAKKSLLSYVQANIVKQHVESAEAAIVHSTGDSKDEEKQKQTLKSISAALATLEKEHVTDLVPKPLFEQARALVASSS